MGQIIRNLYNIWKLMPRGISPIVFWLIAIGKYDTLANMNSLF